MITSSENKSTATPTPSYVKRFVRGALAQAPATLFSAIFSIAVAAFYTRIFTPEQYGVYSFALAITGPVITLLTEWIGQPIGRFYNEYSSRGRLSDLWQLITVLGTIFVVVIIFASSSIYIYFTLSDHLFDRLLYFSACLVVFFQGLSAILLPIFLASFRSEIYRRLTVGSAISGTLISVALIGTFGKNISFLLLGQSIALIASVIITLLLSGWKFNTKHFRASFRLRQTFVRFAKYGLPMMAWFFAASLLDISDRYAIQYFRGAKEMGLYSVNYGLISGLAMLINVPVSISLAPLVFEQWRNRDVLAVSATLKQMTTLYAVLACFFIGLIAVIGKDLVNLLLGEGFRVGYVILVPVLIGRVLWGVSIIGQKTLELQERTLTMALNGLTAAATNVVMNILLVPRFGYIAAAYTTLVSYGIYVALIWFQAKGSIQWSIDFYVLLKAGSSVFLSVIITILFLTLIKDSLSSLILGTAIFSFFSILTFGVMYSPLRLVAVNWKSKREGDILNAK